MKLGIIILIAFVLLIPIPVFAASHSIPSVSASTELSTYRDGDDVVITGNITNYDSSSGELITYFIRSPINELVTIGQVTPSSNGYFEYSFTAGGPLWRSSGDYIAESHFGEISNVTIIVFTSGSAPEPEPTSTSSSTPQSTSQPTPAPESTLEPTTQQTTEPEPKPESKQLGIASFVDKLKDPQYYVDRYNNEPLYKKWFDENYPQYDSIEQAVGLELTKKIPSWIKSIFGLYSQDQISEDELLNAIKYLIDEGILVVK